MQTILRGSPLMHVRQVVGHIHYFTKEITLQALKDAGYAIIDHFYTAGQLELPRTSTLSKFARLPRRILFALHQDLALHLLGGYSLMILAR